MEASYAFEDLHLGLLDVAPAATVAPVAALPATPTIAPAAYVAPPSSPAADQPPATPAPVAVDHVAAWNQAVAAEMKATGCSQSAAVRTIATTRQDLHSDFIRDYTARGRARSAPSRPSSPTGAVAAWEAAVRAEMQTSKCSRATAVRNVACSQKQLHADYLAAFNQQARAAR